MRNPLDSRRGRFLDFAFLAAALFICSGASTAGAQDADSKSSATSDRRWAYPSHGPDRDDSRRAGGRGDSWWDQGPWYASVSAGPAWFDGDGISGTADFAAEVRLARDLSDEVYLLGSYTFGLVDTEVEDDLGGSTDEETHDLHAFALGVGLRLEATPEVQFFVEPRAGVLFGSDADAAPVGMLSGGVEVFVTEGIAVRFAVTGLVTDSDIDADGPDANLESGVMGTLGISFEF